MNKNNNLDDIPLTDIDYEGVIYEPSDNDSDATDDFISSVNPSKSSTASSSNAGSSKKRVAQNFNFNMFIGGISAVTLGILALTFSLISPYVSEYFDIPSSNTDDIAVSKVPTSGDEFFNNLNNQTVSLSDNVEYTFTGVIRETNFEEEYFIIYDFKTNKAHTVKGKPSSKYQDRFGLPLTIRELQIGDIVDFSFDTENYINYIKINPDTFSLDNVRPEKIGIVESVIRLNGYEYDVSTTADIYQGTSLLTLSEISTADKISVKGYHDTIYSIKVNGTSGTLTLINKPNLANGIIEIDRDFFKPLDTVTSVELEEGEHKIVIKCSTLDPYLKDFTIEAGKETILDLADLQNKPGNLLLDVNVADYTLYLNGETIETGAPLSLIYGTYSIKLVKEGYETYETQIIVNKPNDTVEIKMEKLEKTGNLTLSSNPSGAQVFIDNILVGETPIKYKLAHGTHTIKLALDGYNDFLLSSVNISDEDTDFNVTLYQKTSETVATTQATTEATTQSTTYAPMVPTTTYQYTTTTYAPIVPTTSQNVSVLTTEPTTQYTTQYTTEATTETTTQSNLITTEPTTQYTTQANLITTEPTTQYTTQSNLITTEPTTEHTTLIFYTTQTTTQSNLITTEATTQTTTRTASIPEVVTTTTTSTTTNMYPSFD